MTDTLYFNPLIQSYTTSSPDPFFANYADTSNPSCKFPIDKRFVRSILINSAETYTFTPSDLRTDDGATIVMKVVGAARIKTTGLDTDRVTPITGYLPTYGTDLLPGYVLLSTFNVTAFEILGQADATTIELFYGSKEDIVPSNIGLVTQSSRLYSAKLSLTSTVVVNVTATPLVLSEGSYEIRALALFEQSGSVVTGFNLGVSLTTAALPASDTLAVPSAAGEVKLLYQSGSALPFTNLSVSIPSYVVVVAANTTKTLYLVCSDVFGSGTSSVCGWIEARKVL